MEVLLKDPVKSWLPYNVYVDDRHVGGIILRDTYPRKFHPNNGPTGYQEWVFVQNDRHSATLVFNGNYGEVSLDREKAVEDIRKYYTRRAEVIARRNK